jgi:hypothetical protein
MFIKLLKHQRLELLRSSFWTTSLVQSLFLMLFALYFILNFVVLGFWAESLIENAYPDQDLVKVFSGFMVYYFLADIMIRFLMQKFPGIEIKKYLTLNVPKASLTHYIILKSLFSFFNLLPLFVVFPFFFKTVIKNLSIGGSLTWLLLMLSGILISNFLSYFLDRKIHKNSIFAFIILGGIAVYFSLEYRGDVQLMNNFQDGIESLYSHPMYLMLPIGILALIYGSLYIFLRAHVYLDEGATTAIKTINTYDFPLFKFFDSEGKWMQLESKMIWRNKRSRQFLLISILFLFYPFFFISNDTSGFNSRGTMILISLVMTGAFSLNYGQLLLSWNSSHFDTIITQNLSIRKYLKAKYYLLAVSNVVLFICSLPYAFLNVEFILIAFVMMLFNTGVVIWMYFFLSLYNSKKIDPSKGSMMNYEGIGAAHFLIIIPIIAVPLAIYLVFRLAGIPIMGIFTPGIIGLAGILLRSKFLNKAVATFNKRKYKLQNTFSKS